MPVDTCPKRMEFGPCGGVRFDGSCEVAEHQCTFVDVDTVRWSGTRIAEPPQLPAAVRMRRLLATRPVVVADFPARAMSAQSIRDCADLLRGRVDAVLAGDSPRAREQFPTAYRAHLIRSSGLSVWSGLNCRDRNRVALQGELAALADAGASAVLCVTGDHPATGGRPDAGPVFDLDSTRLAALAREAGHLVAVGESPAVPPVARRAARLIEKVRAGAELCFVDHAGGIEPVRSFIADTRALGVDIGFIPCVPVVTDAGSAELLLSFTSLVLPEGYLAGILGAADVRTAGIAAAIDLSRRFLELDGVVGVDLSGGGAAGDELATAEAIATIGEAVLR